jgi:hypothetical protein
VDVGADEDRVEGGGELGVAIPDQESEATAHILKVHEQVAGQLGQPGSGRVGGDADDVRSSPINLSPRMR